MQIIYLMSIHSHWVRSTKRVKTSLCCIC